MIYTKIILLLLCIALPVMEVDFNITFEEQVYSDVAILKKKNAFGGQFDSRFEFSDINSAKKDDIKWPELNSTLQMSNIIPAGSVGIGGGFDDFGSSVAIDGNRALIGAARVLGHGVVYVYDFDTKSNTWQETEILKPSNPLSDDMFGTLISFSGDRAFVAANKNANSPMWSGSVYVFDFDGNTWNETAKLTASDGFPGDEFSASLSFFGDRVMIGATGADGNSSNSGAVYIFDFDGSTWSETAKITTILGLYNDEFGSSVSLSSNRALIGASGADGNISNSGVVYVYDFDGIGWNENTKLTASDGGAADKFGSSISVSGNRVLIGAFGDYNDIDADIGSAYIFDYDGSIWSETSKLTASDGARRDFFGTSVTLSGNRALIGAHKDDDNGINSGSTYVFDFDGSNWSETAKITASNGMDFNVFGTSVSLDGDRAVIGAPSNFTGQDQGFVYIFDFDGTNWTENIFTAGGTAGKYFGMSVSFSGNRVLIGTLIDEAYVFDFDGDKWIEMVKLTTIDDSAQCFGRSVSLWNNRALIGARCSDGDDAFNVGSVYVFDFDGNNWSQTAKLTASDGSGFDHFGGSVSLLGNRALIGAQGSYDYPTGSAYVYDYDGSTWNETKLVISNTYDYFVTGVSLWEDRALVGAYFNEDEDEDYIGDPEDFGSAHIFDFDGVTWNETRLVASNSGDDSFGIKVSLSSDRALIGANKSESAYVYDFDGFSWNETKLTASDGAFNDSFGASVSLSENRALIGTPGDNDDKGSAYVFDFDGISWNETKLTVSDGDANDWFGYSVSLSGNKILVGAPSDDDNGLNSGSVYYFEPDIIYISNFE